jgi:hypothetical protein
LLTEIFILLYPLIRQISKELVEVHIQTNKVREQYEKDIFDLKIKVMLKLICIT